MNAVIDPSSTARAVWVFYMKSEASDQIKSIVDAFVAWEANSYGNGRASSIDVVSTRAPGTFSDAGAFTQVLSYALNYAQKLAFNNYSMFWNEFMPRMMQAQETKYDFNYQCQLFVNRANECLAFIGDTYARSNLIETQSSHANMMHQLYHSAIAPLQVQKSSGGNAGKRSRVGALIAAVVSRYV